MYPIETGIMATGIVDNVEAFVGRGVVADLRIIGMIVMCFFWLASLIWVIKDANARSESLPFQFLAVVMIVALTPVFGLPLYFALRPRGWKWDKTIWRDVIELKGCFCENCGDMQPVEHRCCTKCGETLQHPCRECSEFYVNSYEYCPCCGAPNIDQ